MKVYLHDRGQCTVVRLVVRERLLEQPIGTVHVVALLRQQREVELRRTELRIDLEGLAQDLLGLGVVALADPCRRSEVVANGVLRVLTNESLCLGQRLIELLVAQQHHHEQHVRAHVLGALVGGRPELLGGERAVTDRKVPERDLGAELGLGGCKLGGTLHCRHALRRLARAHVRPAQHGLELWIVRAE